MTLLELKNIIGRKQIYALAEKVGTSGKYLLHIAHGHRKPSPDFCRALVLADPRLKLCDLRPDLYRGNAPRPQAVDAMQNFLMGRSRGRRR